MARVYTIGTKTHAVQRSFQAWRAIIVLECLFQNQITALQFFVNLMKLAFLKALANTKDFIENTELNKRHSGLVAALE